MYYSTLRPPSKEQLQKKIYAAIDANDPKMVKAAEVLIYLYHPKPSEFDESMLAFIKFPENISIREYLEKTY